jgi:hypothetical protein
MIGSGKLYSRKGFVVMATLMEQQAQAQPVKKKRLSVRGFVNRQQNSLFTLKVQYINV